MTEHFPLKRRIATGMAITIAAAGLAGCSDIAPTETKPPVTHASPMPPKPLKRCFTKPQPEAKLPELPKIPEINDKYFDKKLAAFDKAYEAQKKYYRPAPIKLHYSEILKSVIEAPVSHGPVVEKLKNANVQIDAGELKGSGFVTKAPDGGDIVITAAHVTAVNDLNKIEVSNNTGEKVKAVSACYMYEKDGKFSSLSETYNATEENPVRPGEVDVAVLRLAKPIGETSLTLATSFSKRGSWVTFVNNQLDNSPSTPAIYSGLVVSRSPGPGRNTVLTGLESWKKDAEGEDSYIFNQGGSGGLLADDNGSVVGLTYSAGEGYDTAKSTSDIFGVTIKNIDDDPTVHTKEVIGTQTGVLPVTAGIIGADVLQLAIRSHNY